MTSEATEERQGFSDLLAELTDSDVVAENIDKTVGEHEAA